MHALFFLLATQVASAASVPGACDTIDQTEVVACACATTDDNGFWSGLPGTPLQTVVPTGQPGTPADIDHTCFDFPWFLSGVSGNGARTELYAILRMTAESVGDQHDHQFSDVHTTVQDQNGDLFIADVLSSQLMSMTCPCHGPPQSVAAVQTAVQDQWEAQDDQGAVFTSFQTNGQEPTRLEVLDLDLDGHDDLVILLSDGSHWNVFGPLVSTDVHAPPY